MIRCNVCKIEKEENNFQTYWHSTQQKMRTRKQCNDCYYGARLKYKNPDKYYSDNPDYLKCKVCQEWKLISTNFYSKANGKYYLHRCKECERKLEKEKRLNEIKDSCGSEKVLEKPNHYTDIYQKECTFNMLQLLGYLYDNETGIWYKPGIKEIVDGKPVFLNINPTEVKPNRANKVTIQMIREMIKLKERNWSNKKIADKLNISETTVYKNVMKWKNQ